MCGCLRGRQLGGSRGLFDGHLEYILSSALSYYEMVPRVLLACDVVAAVS
jgi:hypothetical protein